MCMTYSEASYTICLSCFLGKVLIPTNTVFDPDSMDRIARKEGDHGIG
jgi:hypothetical protein